MFIYETKFRVQYYDTDKMGIVHHSNYIRYFEIGRTESMRHIGLSYKDLEESGTSMPVTRIDIRYLWPVYYDELITIKTTVKELPTARITFFYEIFNEQGRLVADGTTVLAFLNITTGRPQRAPQAMVDAIKKYLNNE